MKKMSAEKKFSEVKPYKRSCSTLYERILVQMTKLVKLCEEEGYNDKTLNPSRKVIAELRTALKVHRVTDGMVEYKHEEDEIIWEN